MLSEPKPGTWFERAERAPALPARDRRSTAAPACSTTSAHVFINGEAFRAGGRDATLMRRLADRRRLDAAQRRRALSAEARELLAEWLRAGWCARRRRTLDEEPT